MNTAEKCVGCKPSSTCGFSCYYYWKGGRPVQKFYSSKLFVRKKIITTHHDLAAYKAKPSTSKPENKTTPPGVIELSDSDEENQSSKTKSEDMLSRNSNNSIYQHHTGDVTTEPFIHSPNTDDGYFGPIKSSNHLMTSLPSHSALPFLSSEESLPSSKSFSFNTKIEQSPRKHTSDTISCIERKRLIVFSRPEAVKKAMHTWHSETLSLLDPFRSDDVCWFHPSPPRPKISKISFSKSTFGSPSLVRPKTTISKRFTWTTPSDPIYPTDRHSLWLNFGIVSKLLSHSMTRQQKDGFITKGWHLSHLCGNWTCLNEKHTTVEPGIVNVGRNSCFSHRGGCEHSPKCLKELKVPGTEMVNNGDEKGEVAVEDPENWQGLWFDDDEIQGTDDGSEVDSSSAEIKTSDKSLGSDGSENLRTEMSCSVVSEEITIVSV